MYYLLLNALITYQEDKKCWDITSLKLLYGKIKGMRRGENIMYTWKYIWMKRSNIHILYVSFIDCLLSYALLWMKNEF